MNTLQSLSKKMEGAQDIKSVVHAMKTISASNIEQYEQAVKSLNDYYKIAALGMIAYFKEHEIEVKNKEEKINKTDRYSICAIVFGTNQGLVGQFNDSLFHFVADSIFEMNGEKEIWTVGELVQTHFANAGFNASTLFTVPNSVDTITTLVDQILIKSLDSLEKGTVDKFYLFHNQLKSGTNYKPVMQQLLPPDENWKQTLNEYQWPTKKTPQVAGGDKSTILALMREYLFISLYKTCAESLACENYNRLISMQRAEKSIEEILNDLNQKFHYLRQSSIDSELFDIISGFETLKNDPRTL